MTKRLKSTGLVTHEGSQTDVFHKNLATVIKAGILISLK